MRFLNGGIRIQDRVPHDPINGVVQDGSNRIDPAKTIVEGRFGDHPIKATEARKAPLSIGDYHE
jgi:hypothetical protein